MKTKCPLPKGFSGTRRVSGMLLSVLALMLIAASTAVAAPFAYVSNFGSGTVSVIDAGAAASCTGTGQVPPPPCVVATVPVGAFPGGVAVNPAGTLVYVANQDDGTVSVIRTSDNTVVGGPLPVGVQPWGVAVTADNSTVYVGLSGGVAVIDATNNNSVSMVPNVGGLLNGIVAVGSRVFVSDATAGQVVVIQGGNVIGRIDVGSGTGSMPMGLVANSAGTLVYVVDLFLNAPLTGLEVSAIDTTSMAVVGTITIDPDTAATPGGIALSPDGSKLYLTSDAIDRLHIVTLSNGNVVSVPVGDSPVGVATDPDGRVYVANAGAGTVTVFGPTYDPATGLPAPKAVRVGATPFVFGAFTTAGPPPPPPPAQFVLSLSTVGSGTITANPLPVSGTYTAGTVVTLTPNPSTNYQFTGWAGACTGSGSCVVTMDAAKSVTATFTLKQFVLALSTVGNGAISANPQPVRGTYGAGTVVAVTATPASGSQFSGWSGACSGTGACNVTMDAAKSVTATFAAAPPPPPVQFTLTMTSVGDGSIAPQPAPVTPAAAAARTALVTPSGGLVSGSYNAGTIVTLTPVPATGSRFSGWSGACSGTGICSVTMNAAKDVTATFTAVPPSTCDDKIVDLQKKVAAFKHPWWHDHQLKVSLKMYAQSLAELNRAYAKVGSSDKRYVHAKKEFDNGKAALCLGHYWRADHGFWEAWVIAHEILKHNNRR